MATSTLSTPVSSSAAATVDDRRTKAERQVEKEREKLRAKQAAVERAKEKQRQRIEADKQRARGGKPTQSQSQLQPLTDAQTHNQLSSSTTNPNSSRQHRKEEEEKTQADGDAQQGEQQWRREQAEREERLRQAEEQMNQLRLERERVEEEIAERRRQAQREEHERQQRLAREREEEAQRQRQRQAQLDEVSSEERRRRQAEEETKEAARREASRREQEGMRRQAVAMKEAEEAAARRRQAEAEQKRRDEAVRIDEAKRKQHAAAELRKLQQAEKEAENVAAMQPSVSPVIAGTALSAALGNVVLPSWNISHTRTTVQPVDDVTVSVVQQRGDRQDSPPAVMALPTPSVLQAATLMRSGAHCRQSPLVHRVAQRGTFLFDPTRLHPLHPRPPSSRACRRGLTEHPCLVASCHSRSSATAACQTPPPLATDHPFVTFRIYHPTTVLSNRLAIALSNIRTCQPPLVTHHSRAHTTAFQPSTSR